MYDQLFEIGQHGNNETKFSFSMAVLETISIHYTTLNVIDLQRELILLDLKDRGIIITDRLTLIHENKYSSVLDQTFLENDFELLFGEVNTQNCSLRRTNIRESVTIIVDGRPVKFLKYRARGNGDCGYISLNLKRSEIQQAFLSFKPIFGSNTNPNIALFA